MHKLISTDSISTLSYSWNYLPEFELFEKRQQLSEFELFQKQLAWIWVIQEMACQNLSYSRNGLPEFELFKKWLARIWVTGIQETTCPIQETTSLILVIQDTTCPNLNYSRNDLPKFELFKKRFAEYELFKKLLAWIWDKKVRL
jgi:hypothetical protein